MAVLSSTFFSTSLITFQNARNTPLADVQGSRIAFIPAASLQNTEEQHAQRKASLPPSSSWISFFLFRSSQKPPRKLLLEEMEAGSTTAFDTPPLTQEPAKIFTNKGPRGAESPKRPQEGQKILNKDGPKRSRKRVVFTPQKAQELREKLKETDSYHDFMYHSAIASKLASNYK